jgi:hypothetical protein
MAQVTPLRLALVGRAQLVVAQERLAQILFSAPLLQQVVVLELMAMEVTAARAAAQSQPQLEVEQQGKAKMEERATTTARVMLLAVEEVVLVQLV